MSAERMHPVEADHFNKDLAIHDYLEHLKIKTPLKVGAIVFMIDGQYANEPLLLSKIDGQLAEVTPYHAIGHIPPITILSDIVYHQTDYNKAKQFAKQSTEKPWGN